MSAGIDFHLTAALDSIANGTAPGASLARPGGTVDQPRRNRADRSDAADLWYVPAPAIAFLGNQVPFAASWWGPNTGYCWAVQRISVSGLTAGTLNPPTVVTQNGGNVPATGVAFQSPYSVPVQVVIAANGATITNVSVNGVTVGTAAGTYFVPAYGAISVAYSVAVPTWVWTSTVTAADQLAIYRGHSPADALPPNYIDTVTAVGSGEGPVVTLGSKAAILMPDETLVFGGIVTAASLYVASIDVIQMTADQLTSFIN